MRRGSRTMYVLLIVAASCMIYAVSSGIRSNLGIVLKPLVSSSGLSYAEVSYAIAIGQFVYGISQVIFGIMALKLSNRAVLLTGCLLMLLGLALTPLSHSTGSLMLTLGVAFHAGTGATCFGIVMSVATPVMGERRAVWASGIINAGTGMGMVVLAPLMGWLSTTYGASFMLMLLCTPVLLCVIPAYWLSSRPKILSLDARARYAQSHGISVASAAALAFSDGYFFKLTLSFIACGFNLGIIYTHFYSELTAFGMSSSQAASLYSAIGVTTVIGAVLTGMACAHLGSKKVLAWVYFLTAAMIVILVFAMRECTYTLIVLALVAGFFSDAPIAPTSDLVSHRFGSELLGVLFGVAFICVQVGGFMSSSLGGYLVEHGLGYRTLWGFDAAFCLIAALMVMRLGKRKMASPAPKIKPVRALWPTWL